MIKKQIKHEIENIVDGLSVIGLVYHHNIIQEQACDGGLRLSWRHSLQANVPLTSMEFATLNEYKTLLRNQIYTAMLFDGALLQMSYDCDSKGVIGHRLLYYPCPFDIVKEISKGDPPLDVVELLEECAIDTLKLRGPIRFDYAPKEGNGRASSHVHIAHSDCRCPVVAPIMPGQFVRFVVRSFYNDYWHAHEYVRDITTGIGSHTIVESDSRDLHFSCRRR